MWRPWWRHLGYVLQVWRHLGVQIWCAVIRHLGSISEVFEHGWVAHLSASDPPPPPPPPGRLTNHTYTVMWSIYGPHTPLSVYLRVIFVGTPYTCVFYVWDQAVQQVFFRRRECILYWNIFSNFSCDIELNFTLPNIQIWYWYSDISLDFWYHIQ